MRTFIVLLCVALSGAVFSDATGRTAEPLPEECATFTWDVSGELRALRLPATDIVAGDGLAGNQARVSIDTMYRARLLPQGQVELAARPGKPMLDDGATAGLLIFRVPEDGIYRVSITTGHWIDVVDGGEIVPSLDFQGRRGCPLVHKIVAFDLKAGRDLVLQFAGGSVEEAGVVITRAPSPSS